ncbi:MAG: NAD(P)/FAD-dependent oxidoreductase [Actinobacteria bacterium]|nr:MAG: NAD(P)/FAD-dependent oxidoreductase [Actinomycetota bacterium]
MKDFDYDLIIIGAGSAGATAAVNAVSLGANKVLIIERGELGGTCTNTGCVPTKIFLHSAKLMLEAENANRYLEKPVMPTPNWKNIMQRKQYYINSAHHNGLRIFADRGIELIKGKAKLIDTHTVSIDEKSMTAKYILIATGAKAAIPPIKGIHEIDYLTNANALELKNLPQSIIVIGGSYIGLEFASFFNALGSKVFVVESKNTIASTEDEDISDYLSKELENSGIEIFSSAKAIRVKKEGKQILLEISQDKNAYNLVANKLLVATGRKPNLDFNPKAAAIRAETEGILVNPLLQTDSPNIYAAGDVLPTLQLEHVATYEGYLAAHNMFSLNKQLTDYSVVPHVMFTFPEVAAVGITQRQAEESFHIATSLYSYSAIAAASINEERNGIIKLIGDNNTGLLLGAHIIGADAGNLIHLASILMQAKVPVNALAEQISAYPTLAQGFYYALTKLSENISRRKLKAA